MARRALRLRREALAELGNDKLAAVAAAAATAQTLCCTITCDYTICFRCPTDAA